MHRPPGPKPPESLTASAWPRPNQRRRGPHWREGRRALAAKPGSRELGPSWAAEAAREASRRRRQQERGGRLVAPARDPAGSGGGSRGPFFPSLPPRPRGAPQDPAHHVRRDGRRARRGRRLAPSLRSVLFTAAQASLPGVGGRRGPDAAAKTETLYPSNNKSPLSSLQSTRQPSLDSVSMSLTT